MEEREVKIIDVDVKRVVDTLLSWGAKKTFEGEIDAIRYVGPDKDTLVRLRKKGPSAEFVVKKRLPSQRVKAFKEYETAVADFETMKQILEQLGFKEHRRSKKHRISYTLGDTVFEFDTLEGIPTYLEIEAPSEEALFEAAKKLGFNKEQCLNWSENDVIQHYRNQ
ncbi:class IV adenylate cyclase [Candidatus Woesearchaeota archaeon]|nr:MAG: class IV adenylate cyclase [Candidatus Woesearchaeota archaeon]